MIRSYSVAQIGLEFPVQLLQHPECWGNQHSRRIQLKEAFYSFFKPSTPGSSRHSSLLAQSAVITIKQVPLATQPSSNGVPTQPAKWLFKKKQIHFHCPRHGTHFHLLNGTEPTPCLHRSTLGLTPSGFRYSISDSFPRALSLFSLPLADP